MIVEENPLQVKIDKLVADGKIRIDRDRRNGRMNVTIVDESDEISFGIVVEWWIWARDAAGGATRE